MSVIPTLLLVEDELPVRRFLRPAIQGQGWRLVEADTLAHALAQVAARVPDMVIVDLGLPDGDGLELIRRVREWSTMPILILSARDRDRDKVEALDTGADDYVTKPFSLPELLARLRATMRRLGGSGSGSEVAPSFTVGELTVDFARRRVTLAGETVPLTPIEYKLLAAVASHPGRVVTHRALLGAIWGPYRDEAHLVRVHMANLRRKLERDPARPKYLITEPGVGYRLAEE